MLMKHDENPKIRKWTLRLWVLKKKKQLF